MAKYANVIVVARSGGDFTDPLEALNSITDASESNTYLIKIMPGTYEIPPASFLIKPYVDIQGSGRKVTKLVSHSNHMGHAISVVYFVNGASGEIRDITIDHEANPRTPGYGQYVFGVGMWGGGSPRITNVDIIANGGTWSGGMAVGYSYTPGYGSNPTLTNVTIATTPEAGWNPNTNHGIEISPDSVVTLHNVKINSVGPNLSIDGTSTVKGSAVELSSPIATGGNFKCIGCFDSNYNPLP
jgi:hypothetical protein